MTMSELFDRITFMIVSEKQAMKADNPRSMCAANHRGAIAALERVRDLIADHFVLDD